MQSLILALAVTSHFLSLYLHYLFCKMRLHHIISKVSSNSNVFNWDVFITNKSLTENVFLCVVLCHWSIQNMLSGHSSYYHQGIYMLRNSALKQTEISEGEVKIDLPNN